MNWIVRIISISATINLALGCSRIPVGTNAAKSPADDRYVITIGGNPQNFEPDQKYNISLTAVQGYTFIGFMLAVEIDTNNGGNNVGDPKRLGYFEIVDFSETKFSDKCNNLIMQTNMLPKSRVNVVWTAPPAGTGCVLIRATVIEHHQVWYMDDGFLTKQFCEEQQDDIENQPLVMDPCCACDEAKYELTFEGKWSRHTHPKDFPANSWRTRFSDIIGASHTIDYRFWQYGEPASEGLREVAEHGSTRTLESELKEQSDQIRTIIKARGISYPNVTGKTFAVFRVDSNHHLISLVSMIDPSPDWIVGVSGLELCLSNCSWVEHKIHNLYPWDAGTDSGPSYTSADQPQVPHDVIRRIKPNYPNDPRSPFYDPSGAAMKPLARLHISRRRLYEKNCENIEPESDSVECVTHPWGRWSECSTKCGPGQQYRTREFKNPGLARRFKCKNSLREEQNCQGRKCGDFDDGSNTGGGGGFSFGSPDNPECALSDWSDWSGCSATCGKGTRTQTRHYLNRRARKKCQNVSRVLLERNEECEGIDCGGDINGEGGDGGDGGEDGESENENENNNQYEENSENQNSYDNRNFKSLTPYDNYEEVIPPQCLVSPWSSWTPCSKTCGEGYKSRERQVWNNDVNYGSQNINYGNDPCVNIKKQEIVSCEIRNCNMIVPQFCFDEPITGPCRDGDVKTYWYYDYKSDNCALFFAGNCKNNENKFNSKELCEQTCKQRDNAMGLSIESLRLERTDCVVSEWMAHTCNATCGEGYEVKTREVLRIPKNGGKPCPKKLVRWEKCYKRCPDDLHHRQKLQQQRVQNMHMRPPENECRYSDWSAWSPCTATCGDNSVRQQTRVLLNTELSYKCRDRVRLERCIVMPCLLNGDCRGPYC